MRTDPHTGLKQSYVDAQIAAGAHNVEQAPLTRTVGQIIAGNTFTLFNLVNVVIAAFIITTGSYSNLLFLGVAIFNTAIGTFQEIRSKHQLDSLTIVSAPQATVVRDGHTTTISAENLVVGDALQLRRGAQIPVDGVVLTNGNLEVDESALTGEANSITKRPDDAVLSGSFVVAGNATVMVTKVAGDTFAARLAKEAKAEQTDKDKNSKLLATINRIIKVLTYVLIPLGIALFTVSMVRRGDYNRAILTTSAAVIGMIPEGLVLMTNVALAVGARNLGQRRVLVRSLTAIEALARVDTICLDKTGTITTGRLIVNRVVPVGDHDADDLASAVSAVTFALNDDNETAIAIKEYFPQPPQWTVTNTVPFSSARKWSGATFSDGTSYFMGAPEFTFGDTLTAENTTAINDAAAAGYRVLAVGRTPDALSVPLTHTDLIGFVLIADEIRPAAMDTFTYFAGQDVQLKVISGDNPITVASVARRAGIQGTDQYVNMTTAGEQPDYDALVRDYNVFGRVTPEQKKHLIAAYQDAGHTVAMTGDGVNDVLALRQSDCAIAMASGSEAASAIADFVLLDSNFDAMTGVLNEGRRVINNIESVASLFLIKTMYSVALIIIFIFLNADYPIIPINLTPVSAVTVAIPSFFLSLEPNFARVTGQFMKKVMTFAAPAALEVVAYTLLMTWLESALHLSFDTTGTIVALLITCVCYNVLFRVSRPFNRLKVGMLAVIAVTMFGVFFVANHVFSLVSLWNWGLFILYAPLAVSTYPVYIILQEFLGRRVLGRIKWRS